MNRYTSIFAIGALFFFSLPFAGAAAPMGDEAVCTDSAALAPLAGSGSLQIFQAINERIASSPECLDPSFIDRFSAKTLCATSADLLSCGLLGAAFSSYGVALGASLSRPLVDQSWEGAKQEKLALQAQGRQPVTHMEGLPKEYIQKRIAYFELIRSFSASPGKRPSFEEYKRVREPLIRIVMESPALFRGAGEGFLINNLRAGSRFKNPEAVIANALRNEYRLLDRNGPRFVHFMAEYHDKLRTEQSIADVLKQARRRTQALSRLEFRMDRLQQLKDPQFSSRARAAGLGFTGAALFVGGLHQVKDRWKAEALLEKCGALVGQSESRAREFAQISGSEVSTLGEECKALALGPEHAEALSWLEPGQAREAFLQVEELCSHVSDFEKKLERALSTPLGLKSVSCEMDIRFELNLDGKSHQFVWENALGGSATSRILGSFGANTDPMQASKGYSIHVKQENGIEVLGSVTEPVGSLAYEKEKKPKADDVLMDWLRLAEEGKTTAPELPFRSASTLSLSERRQILGPQILALKRALPVVLSQCVPVPPLAYSQELPHR